MQIEIVLVSEVEKLAGQMLKERVAFKSEDSTKYFGVKVMGELVGVVGYMSLPNGSVRFKTDFVLPGYRGKGIYRALFAYREGFYANTGTIVTAYCTEQSLPMYLKHGFREVSKSTSGITYVKKAYL